MILVQILLITLGTWYAIDFAIALYMVVHPESVTIDTDTRQVHWLITVRDFVLHPFVGALILNHIRQNKGDE